MRIAVIGTGYVGLVTGACLARIGHDVTCVDVDAKRIQAVNEGRPPFHEPGLPELLKETVQSGRLRATDNLAEAVTAAEATFIAVGTPSSNGEIDLSYIEQAAAQIGAALRGKNAYHTVVVKSTVVPGTTATLVLATLEKSSGLKAGEFGLCMNPEFLREGCAVKDFMEPDRIVIGQSDKRAGEVLASVYTAFDCPKIFTSLNNAEMIKYASNSLLATLISFSNEIAALCEATPDTDVDQVLDGVHLDRRFSPVVKGELVSPAMLTYLRAGCGFGGSCFPKDVTALRAFAEKRGVTPRILDAVLKTNENRPAQVVALAEQAMGSLQGKSIAVLGIAFKPDTDDLRESPGLAIIDVLKQRGAQVCAYDPLIESIKDLTISKTVDEAVAGADGVIIASALPEFRKLDWAALAATMKSPILVDGRNILRGVQLPSSIHYLPIGRHNQGHNESS